MNQSVLNREIEAKFMVSQLPINWETNPHEFLEQGYVLASPNHSLRLRRIGDRFVQTIKTGQGLNRLEVEIELTQAQFQALWPLTQSKRLTKTRYAIPIAGNLVAELDIYHGSLKGLMTVEVEFETEDQYHQFIRGALPSWFGKEVTGDSKFVNQNLALNGWAQKAGD